MIIRKPLPRAHGLHEPLRHPDHPKPRTRREFLSQGFISGGAMAFVPSIVAWMLANPRVANALSNDINQLKGPCKISSGSGVPFISFDLSGGANLVGSEVMVGGPGGQTDFLSTAGYGKLGLPGNMAPISSAPGTFIDASAGLLFHSDSAIMRGMKTRMSAATLANVNGVVIPALSQNDTANNVWSPLYAIAKTGTKGSLLTLAGTSNSPSGGNSVALMSMIDASIAPTKISQPSDLVGLAPGGSGTSLFTGPTAKADMVSTVEFIERVSLLKLALPTVSTGLSTTVTPPATLSPEGLAKQQVQCSYARPANTAEVLSGPKDLDPLQDVNITGAANSIFSATEITQGDFMKTAAIMKLIVNGFGGAATIQMGGFDYHSGNRSDGETRNFNAGVCIGACLEYAARVGHPLMLQVFSDGSLNSNMTIDNSAAGRGKLSWQGDNQSTAATFFLVYSPNGRPPLLGADKQQLGWFTTDGSVMASSSPAANAVNLAVELITLNYLGLNGRAAEMPTLFPGTAFGSAALIDKYTAFGAI